MMLYVILSNIMLHAKIMVNSTNERTSYMSGNMEPVYCHT